MAYIPYIHVTNLESWESGDKCIFVDTWLDSNRLKNDGITRVAITDDNGYTVKYAQVFSVQLSDYTPKNPIGDGRFYNVLCVIE